MLPKRFIKRLRCNKCHTTSDVLVFMKASSNPLTPELCRTFLAIEQCGGSLTAAAIQLDDDKANLSKRIRPLVNGLPPHLPRPWLHKDGKKFRLTDEGRKMIGPAKELLERWQNFVSFANAGRLPGLTIACGQEAAGSIVLEAATRFRKTHRDVLFKIVVVRGRRRIEGVANGLYDVALVTNAKPEIDNIARRETMIHSLEDDELVLACGAKSQWAAAFATETPVKLDELQSWPLVLPEADSALRQQFDELLRRRNAAANVAMEVGGWQVALRYVIAGFGVGLLPKSVVAEAASRVKLRPLEKILRPMNRVQIVTLPTPANAELVTAFVEELRAAIH